MNKFAETQLEVALNEISNINAQWKEAGKMADAALADKDEQAFTFWQNECKKCDARATDAWAVYHAIEAIVEA